MKTHLKQERSGSQPCTTKGVTLYFLLTIFYQSPQCNCNFKLLFGLYLKTLYVAIYPTQVML